MDIENVLGAAPVRRERGKRPWIVAAAIVLLLVLLLAVFIAIAWFLSDDKSTDRYRTQPAQRGNLTVVVSATGTLEPTDQVTVGTEVSGTVAAAEADYNDEVAAGQVLARLDTTKLQAQARQSQAALESARAKVLQAQASVEEVKTQLARLERTREAIGTPSQSDVDAARATFKRAEADLQSAHAIVSQSEALLNANLTDLGKAVIRSPVNGIVLTRSVEPGQTVAATLQAPVLFVIAEDLRKMELRVDVDEADVGRVRASQRATFTVDAYPDRTFVASVTQVRYGSQTVGGVVTYPALLTVDNSNLQLRPGMTATAEIVVEDLKDVLLVPTAALRFEPATPNEEGASEQRSGGLIGRLMPRPMAGRQNQRDDSTRSATRKQQVWTLRDGRPIALAVETGATDGTSTQVTGGDVQAGTELIVDELSPD